MFLLNEFIVFVFEQLDLASKKKEASTNPLENQENQKNLETPKNNLIKKFLLQSLLYPLEAKKRN